MSRLVRVFYGLQLIARVIVIVIMLGGMFDVEPEEVFCSQISQTDAWT